MENISRWMKKIWKDPVWSSVISSIIVFGIINVPIYLYGLFKSVKLFQVYKSIFNYFLKDYLVKAWYFILLHIVILVLGYFFYKKKRKEKLKNRTQNLDLEKPKLTKIEVAPTVFFHYRFVDAFPKLYGLKWFDDLKTIYERLSILLEQPTSFDRAEGHGIEKNPVWWFRGEAALPIKKFELLNNGKCLINSLELKIEKIAAYRGDHYYQDFVYVQCEEDEPCGIYDHDPEQIKKEFDRNRSYKEIFGIFEGTYISKQEFDDGSALINGKPVRTGGAIERIRHLTKYNFIIAAKYSPYNSQIFTRNSGPYFGKLLRNESNLDEFIKWLNKLPKHYND